MQSSAASDRFPANRKDGSQSGVFGKAFKLLGNVFFGNEEPEAKTAQDSAAFQREHEIASLKARASRQQELLSSAAEFNRLMNNTEGFEATVELVLRYIESQVGATDVTLFLLDERSGQHQAAARLIESELKFRDEIDLLGIRGLLEIENDECVVSKQILQANLYTISLAANRRNIGALRIVVPHSDSGEEIRENLDILEHMKALFALSLTKVILRQKSTTDQLTELRNKAYFTEFLTEAFKDAKLGKTAIGLLMIDIDKFKAVNDTYGHLSGDIILREVGKILRNHGEKNEAETFRYGGEELNLVLTRGKVTIEEMRKIAEDIRAEVQRTAFFSDKGELVPCTLSIGVSVYDEPMTSKEELYTRADECVYAAKNGGRNMVVCYGPELEKLRAEALPKQHGRRKKDGTGAKSRAAAKKTAKK
ncbi:MAG: GGDEF domain-containing protein [Planctomycetes bacterium]|nr:GGDEF domain-containing protein [Planctomycetota bacterium]